MKTIYIPDWLQRATCLKVLRLYEQLRPALEELGAEPIGIVKGPKPQVPQDIQALLCVGPIGQVLLFEKDNTLVVIRDTAVDRDLSRDGKQEGKDYLSPYLKEFRRFVQKMQTFAKSLSLGLRVYPEEDWLRNNDLLM